MIPMHNWYLVINGGYIVEVNRKSVYCRYFKTAEQAAMAYNDAAKKYFGEFANFK